MVTLSPSQARLMEVCIHLAPGWLCIIVGEVPSTAVKIMVGDGQGPPVDHGAIEK
jgi:hypothetical protein